MESYQSQRTRNRTNQYEYYDVIVVGAGEIVPYTRNIGIILMISEVSRDLSLRPATSLFLVDRNNHVGGDWSLERIHPRFFAQLTVGLAEYSDLKMRQPSKGDLVGDGFRTKSMTEYLEEFAEKMIHNGKSLRDRFQRLDVAEIVRAEEDKSGNWKVSCADYATDRISRTQSETAAPYPVVTTALSITKLIMACGESSTPNIPTFPHRDQFDTLIIHSTDFGASDVLATPDIHHISILGAGKSSADMLYSCLKSLPPHTRVHWVISETGTGPV